MNVERILLQMHVDFGLKLNDRIIIKNLLENKPLTADEICEKVGIPKGRIYEYLRDLIAKKLILKTEGQPACYYIDSLEKRLIEFCCEDIMRTIKNQNGIFSKTADVESITSLTNLSEFSFIKSRERFLAKKLDYVPRDKDYPPFFYGFDDEAAFLDFTEKFNRIPKVKEKISADEKKELLFSLRSFKHLVDKKAPIRYVIGRASYSNFMKHALDVLGKKKFSEKLRSISDFLEKNKNVEIKVIDESCAYSLMVTEDTLVFAIVEPPSGRTFVNGFLLTGKNSVENYRSIFETRFEKGQDLIDFIKKELVGIK